MQVDMLYTINPPNEQTPAPVVAKNIISLYRTEYSITFGDICNIFRCERQWATDWLLPQVRHIFLNKYFRQYIIDLYKDDLSEHEFSNLGRWFYYFSRKDLVRWWNETAEATVQTRLIDLTDYAKPGVEVRKLLREHDRHADQKPSRQETARHLATLEQLLTAEGFALYTQSLKPQRLEWVHIKTPPLFSDPPLFTVADWLQEHGQRSPALAYRDFRKTGTIKLKVGGKVLWKAVPFHGKWPISIPY